MLASIAEVVELVDTLASGASGGNPVEVRVLFSAPFEFCNSSLESWRDFVLFGKEKN